MFSPSETSCVIRKVLEELNLLMCLLQANNIVVLAQALRVVVLHFSWEEAVKLSSRLVFHVATQRPASRMCRQVSLTKGFLPKPRERRASWRQRWCTGLKGSPFAITFVCASVSCEYTNLYVSKILHGRPCDIHTFSR